MIAWQEWRKRQEIAKVVGDAVEADILKGDLANKEARLWLLNQLIGLENKAGLEGDRKEAAAQRFYRSMTFEARQRLGINEDWVNGKK